MDYKEITDRINRHYKERGQLRKDICEAVHDMLAELGGTLKLQDEEFEDYITICYDGGNHVEYASTMCADVHSVTAVLGDNEAVGNNGCKTFTVEIEQDDRLEEWRLIFDDVTEIFDVVSARYNLAKGLQ